MRIQNIQQNNTNFQGLYGSKSALRKLNSSQFQRKVENLAKDCDVLVKKETDEFWPPALTMPIGTLCGIITGLSMDSISSALSVGFVSSIVSLFSFSKIFTNNTIQIGEKIKKDDKSGELEFEGVKSDEITLDEKADLDEIEKRYISGILKKGSVEPLKLCIKSGKVNLLDKNPDYLKSRMSEDEYKQIIDAFLQFHQTKDEDGNLPIHKIKDGYDAVHLHDYFQNNMDDLAEIYLTRNNNGDLPIHNPSIMNNYGALSNLSITFENYPRLLVTIFEAKNQQGESVNDVLQKTTDRENQDLIEYTLKKVRNAKDYCIKKNGNFIPMIAKSERETLAKLNGMMSPKIDFQNIMKILKNVDCQNSKGYLLNNSNYITKVIDFTINESSKEEEKAIIEELQKLPNIDYNKVDENDISIVEKIMNAENSELLKLLDGKKLNYYPELDYAFERIENSDFKKQLVKLNFEFKDLEQAVRMKSMHSLEMLKKQFSSPLFKKEYNGKALLNMASLGKNSFDYKPFSEQFREKYGQYLSDYII